MTLQAEVPVGYLVRELGGSTPSKKEPEYWDGSIPWVSPKDMKIDLISDSIDHVTSRAVAETALRIVPESSVLIVVRGMILAHSVPVAETASPVTINQDMKALVPLQRITGRYLRYSLVAAKKQLLAMVEEAGHGTRCLRSEHWRKFKLRVPALGRQKVVIDFLDRKTAAIDALIEKKERLIELLAEKRAALIHQAVTKGLNLDVPLKDSGVPWIGEIPPHWEVVRLKFLADVRGGVTKGRNLEGRETVSLPYLRVANVQDGYLDLAEIHEIEVPKSEIGRYSLRPGDILMNEGGDNDKLGRGAVWNREIPTCLHQNHVFAVRPSDTGNSVWISLCTSASYLKYFFQSRSKQSTNLASISSSNIKEAPVLFPPVRERVEILAKLERDLATLDSVDQAHSSQIHLLSEYRQALITAAVTGHLDIPEAAA